MRARPGARTVGGAGAGIGQFAGRQAPQIAADAVAGELLGSLLLNDGVRTAQSTTGTQRYRADDLNPQHFLAPPATANNDHELAQPLNGNSLNRRRAGANVGAR